MKRLFLALTFASASVLWVAGPTQATMFPEKCRPSGLSPKPGKPSPKCGPIKDMRLLDTISSPDLFLADNSGGQGSKPGAPKPGGSTKDWKEYINGKPKPREPAPKK